MFLTFPEPYDQRLRSYEPLKFRRVELGLGAATMMCDLGMGSSEFFQ